MAPASSSPAPPRPRWTQHAVFGAASAACAFLLVRVVVLFYQKDYGRAADAAWGVVTGHPHWRVYQSRVLGPWTVALLSHVFPSFLAAHVAYSWLTLAAAGFLVLTFTQQRYGDAWRSWAAFFMFQCLFVFLMSRPWLYAWDYLELIVFLVFFDLVQRGRAWWRVLALFAVAIFNRESALFIAVWLVVQPLVAFVHDRRARGREAGADRGGRGRRARKRPVRLAWRPCLVGVMGLAGGLALIEGLRRSLLVEEMGPILFADVKSSPEQGLDPSNLVGNLHRMAQSLTTFSYAMDFLLVPVLVAFVALAVALARRDPRRWLALSLVHVGLLGSLLFHGYFFETRIYLALVPFVVLGVQALFPRSAGADDGGGAST